MQDMNFTFSDMIAGYVQSYDFASRVARMETSEKIVIKGESSEPREMLGKDEFSEELIFE